LSRNVRNAGTAKLPAQTFAGTFGKKKVKYVSEGTQALC